MINLFADRKRMREKSTRDEEEIWPISDISNGFGFPGGLGVPLRHEYHGGTVCEDGGKQDEQFPWMLTNNRFLAAVLGALITAIIQSSGSPTVMVVGFVMQAY